MEELKLMKLREEFFVKEDFANDPAEIARRKDFYERENARLQRLHARMKERKYWRAVKQFGLLMEAADANERRAWIGWLTARFLKGQDR